LIHSWATPLKSSRAVRLATHRCTCTTFTSTSMSGRPTVTSAEGSTGELVPRAQSATCAMCPRASACRRCHGLQSTSSSMMCDIPSGDGGEQLKLRSKQLSSTRDERGPDLRPRGCVSRHASSMRDRHAVPDHKPGGSAASWRSVTSRLLGSLHGSEHSDGVLVEWDGASVWPPLAAT